MGMIVPLLLVLALVLFALAAFGVNSKINLLAAGLAFWVLSAILSVIRT